MTSSGIVTVKLSFITIDSSVEPDPVGGMGVLWTPAAALPRHCASRGFSDLALMVRRTLILCVYNQH